MADKKGSFVLYLDYKKHIDKLADPDRLKLYDAIFDYVEGKEVKLDGAADFVFGFIQDQLDRDALKYHEACEKKQRAAQARHDKEKQQKQQMDALIQNTIDMHGQSKDACICMDVLKDHKALGDNEDVDVDENVDVDVDENEDVNEDVDVDEVRDSKESQGDSAKAESLKEDPEKSARPIKPNNVIDTIPWAYDDLYPNADPHQRQEDICYCEYVVNYFCEKYKTKFSKPHPRRYTKDAWKIVKPIIEGVGMMENRAAVEDWKALIDKYMQTRFEGCDYSLNHFLNENIISNRYFEMLY